MTELDLNRAASKEFLRDRKNLVEVLNTTSDQASKAALVERAHAVRDYVNHYDSTDNYPLSYFVDDTGTFQLQDFAGALAHLLHKAQPKIMPAAAEHLIPASMRYFMGEANCNGRSGDKVASWRVAHGQEVIARAAALTIMGFLNDCLPEKPHAEHEARLEEMMLDVKNRLYCILEEPKNDEHTRAGFVYGILPNHEHEDRLAAQAEFAEETAENDEDESADNEEEPTVHDPNIEQKEFLFRMGLVNAACPEEIELPSNGQEFKLDHIGYKGYSLFCLIVSETNDGDSHYYYNVAVSTKPPKDMSSNDQ